MSLDPGLFLMSFLVGIMIGLTSMGGAALMTPFLILVVGVKPVLAVGTDLAYGAVTKIVGAWVHWKQGTVDLAMVKRLAYGSLPGGFFGVIALAQVHRMGIDADSHMKRALGIVLVVVALVMLIRTFRPEMFGGENPAIQPLGGSRATIWGFLVGFAVGFTSVGSGSLIAPLLMYAYPGKPARVVGTDVFHACLLVATTASLHIGSGHVDWSLLPALLLGSIPGVTVGSFLAPRMPSKALRVSLGLVLLATGAKLF